VSYDKARSQPGMKFHATRGDILRQEKAIAALEVDIDRIKVRLDLSDA